MSVSTLALVFEHINKGGRSRLYGVPRSARYSKADDVDLDDISLRDLISSTEVFSSSDAVNNLVLFDGGRFDGDFRQMTNAHLGSSLVTNMTAQNFNDRAGSLLMIASGRGAEFRLSFRDQFLNEWKTTIDAQLGSDASRVGDPTMTWEVFPRNVSYLDPNLTYLKIRQNLNINIDWWPDYSAWIQYHIRLYLDGAHHVRGYCARWEYWIEGGIKTGGIEDRLRPKVQAGASTLTTKLGAKLGALSFTVSDLYLLPGRQLSPRGTGVSSGNSNDDVTIVVQL
jgi:hypothetical protein